MIRKFNYITILCTFVLLTGCKQVAKSSLKKGTKETVKEVIETSNLRLMVFESAKELGDKMFTFLKNLD